MATNKKSSPIDIYNTVDAETLEKIIDVQFKSLIKHPEIADTLAPLMIWGSPGCGKSSVVREYCKANGLDFIDARLAQMEPADLRGLPVANREKQCMDWYVNGTWPRDPNGKGIIFLDELSAASRDIQVAAYELVLDRRLGKLYHVPNGYMIVAAGNLVTDRAVATTMSSALANRFTHVELKEDATSWVTWARKHDIHPAVCGFIQYKPSMMFNMEGENLTRGWPTPRSWERVSQLCENFKNEDENVLRTMVYGTVGNGAGVEFMEFFKINAEFDNVLEYMINPDKDTKKLIASVEGKLDRKYALVSAMLYLLWKGKNATDQAARVDGFMRIVNELSSDFASMAMIGAMEGKTPAEKTTHCSVLFKNAGFKIFQKNHGAALRKRLDVSKFAA